MLETAELGQAVDKATYDAQETPLRTALLQAQARLRQYKFPVVILFAGIQKAGTGETVNLLNEWMDPRWIKTVAFGDPTQEMRERPPFWKFWMALPKRGQIGLLDSAWYERPLRDKLSGRADQRHFDDMLDNIANFERTLADDGALVLKFWMHLGRADQEKRLQALSADPLTAWRVSDHDWRELDQHEAVVASAEHMIMRTSTARAPWMIVEGADARYRSLRVGTLILDAIEQRLAHEEAAADAKAAEAQATAFKVPTANILSTVVMPKKRMPKQDYRTGLAEQQGRLHALQREALLRGVSTVLVFEGWDAGGKGGAIRRITRALDARQYQVLPIAAPTDEENQYHYLWRFWRHLPRAGRVTIFDRSWYGRVLVERVEGFATEAEWRRAYAEINQFEARLCDHGSVVQKFWLHISKEEQAARFKERMETPHKRWKITDEDWRNRKQWSKYEVAVHDMIERTSTRRAPWHIIPGDDKRTARVKVISAVCDALEAALGGPVAGPIDRDEKVLPGQPGNVAE
ncbi:MAG: polyphosphate:AMP phosphotransferase [Myxococcales bacterium]|nr:polyphosphate:AMP phosphotransferase [Myxococcales bacterium]